MSLAPYVLKGVRRAALSLVGFVARSTTVGIVASTTHSIAGGTPLTTAVNVVATCANVGDAVTLPTMVVGQELEIYNDGANALAVYPPSSGIAIDSGSAGASVALTATKRAKYVQVSATAIKSAQLGVVSA